MRAKGAPHGGARICCGFVVFTNVRGTVFILETLYVYSIVLAEPKLGQNYIIMCV